MPCIYGRTRGRTRVRAVRGNQVRFNGWEAWTFSSDGLVANSVGTFDATEYERQLAEGT